MKFSDLGLSEKTLKAVADIGYTEATPIQEKAIPEILKRNDVIGIAQTGTGERQGESADAAHFDFVADARPGDANRRVLSAVRQVSKTVHGSAYRRGIHG